MFYRSYGALLVIIAVLVTKERPREQFPMAAAIAGLILLIDLPLRFLGNIVPWRSYETPYWPISPYRGSHVFYIPTWLFGVLPTWLFGVLGLVIAAAAVGSPEIQTYLDWRPFPREEAQNNPQLKREWNPAK